jgi:cellulose synthase/poly-beta-1,6-N-acetylglucosamine synthase-like glycosyltransferase
VQAVNEGERSVLGALNARGLLSLAQIQQIERCAAQWHAGLIETLLALRLIDPPALAEALASTTGLQLLSEPAAPLDPDFAEPGDLDFFVRHQVLPWRREQGHAVIAVVNPYTAEPALDEELAGEPYVMRITTKGAFNDALLRAHGDRQVGEATDRLVNTFPALCARSGLTFAQILWIMLLLGGAAWGFSWAPGISLAIAALLAGIFYITSTLFRLVLVLVSLLPRRREQSASHDGLELGGLPHYSVLVALHDEADLVEHTVEAIGRLDYPWTKLDILLLLEESDLRTRAACAALPLDGRFSVLVVPNRKPRTKPKACNFGLAFARGDFVAIYDAEDRPAPDQLLRALAQFRHSSPDVACMQARLNFYNARENWLTSQFALEFAIWFQFILPGLERLNLPIPLGGTSNHFRRESLRAVGGWDAHNVTEDADIGIRMSRLGLRTNTLASATAEEANCALPNWIHQRSRWLKGYLQTYLVHMRRPSHLWRDLGPAGFLSFQLLIGGAVLSPVLHLLFWIGLSAHLAGAPVMVGLNWALLFTRWNLIVLIVGNGAAILCGLIASMQSDFRGLNRPGLALSAISMPIYWFLIAFAAVKGLFSYLSRPFYWAKTRHGISRVLRAGPSTTRTRTGGSSRAPDRAKRKPRDR